MHNACKWAPDNLEGWPYLALIFCNIFVEFGTVNPFTLLCLGFPGLLRPWSLFSSYCNTSSSFPLLSKTESFPRFFPWKISALFLQFTRVHYSFLLLLSYSHIATFSFLLLSWFHFQVTDSRLQVPIRYDRVNMICWVSTLFYIFKYTLLIMLLQLPQFLPLWPPLPGISLPSTNPPP